MSAPPIATVTATAKRHAVKTVGGASLAALTAWCYATFATLEAVRDLRRDVQELREQVAVLEWAHERAGRHATQVLGTNAVIVDNLVVAP